MSDFQWAILENIATVVATAALVLGLYAMGAGAHAGWGFLLLINMNTGLRIKS